MLENIKLIKPKNMYVFLINNPNNEEKYNKMREF